jgi:hypothetical protein
MLVKNSSFCTTQKSSVSTGFTEQTMPILRILCYNGSLVTSTAVSLTTAKFKTLVFSMAGFLLSYTAKMFILIILYDSCLSPIQFCYIIVYIGKVESRVQIAVRCATWKNFQLCEELSFECAAILRDRCLPLITRRDKRKSLLI